MRIADYIKAAEELRKFHHDYEEFRYATAYDINVSYKVSLHSEVNLKASIAKIMDIAPARISKVLREQFNLVRSFFVSEVKTGFNKDEFALRIVTVQLTLHRIV